MLPRLDVQPVILYRRRWRNGVTPGRTKPLDASAISGFAGYRPECVKNVVELHLAHSVKQRARIIEHTSRLLSPFEQLRYKITHPLITRVEYLRVMIVAGIRMSHHMLQVADFFGLGKRLVGVRYDWLVHMQGYREGAFDVGPVN